MRLVEGPVAEESRRGAPIGIEGRSSDVGSEGLGFMVHGLEFRGFGA